MPIPFFQVAHGSRSQDAATGIFKPRGLKGLNPTSPTLGSCLPTMLGGEEIAGAGGGGCENV